MLKTRDVHIRITEDVEKKLRDELAKVENSEMTISQLIRKILNQYFLR